MSASAGMSATGTSPSADFEAKFGEYNDIHKSLKDPRFSQYTVKHRAIGDEINTASKLLEGTIEESVAKKKALDELTRKLPVLTIEYNKIHDGITVNNEKLKELKVLITEAIAAKTVAAAEAAAKAAQDASTAAQALADAKTAVQTQIVELKKLKDDRTIAFEKELTSKNKQVLHMVQPVIPNKVDGIKNLLQGEHISQTTRDMVEGIDNDINTFKSNVDFKSIATQFTAKNDAEIAAIQGQIDALTGAMSGGDINKMQSALASTPLPLSTTLRDFIGAANNFVTTTLDAKLIELDNATLQVETAIAKDLNIFQEEEAKIRELQLKIDDFNYAYDKIHDIQRDFYVKKDVCDKIQTEKATALTPQQKQIKSLKLDSSITALNTVLKTLEHEIDTYSNPAFIIQPLNEIELRRKQQNITRPLEGKTEFETKIAELNTIKNQLREEYRRYELIQNENRQDMSSSLKPQPPTSIRTGENPRRPVARSTSPQEGWVKEQTLKPIPIDEEPDAVDADIASEPVTPPAPIIGARRNFLYVSHNTEPKTAYLVVVKKPRLDDSQGGGGGNKNYHVQKGGAPPPDDFPEDSEIFPIDTNNPNFLDVMAGFIPPSELLKVSPDGTQENPIISNIRSSGRRPKGDLNELYDKIKNELITEENQNALTIGLRAVYYQNIIKLIRLLDYNLNPGRRVHQEMYEKLRKFMDFTYGTFGVLEALFDATFKHNPTSPRPNTPPPPPPKIDAVFKKKSTIKKIVGWQSNTKNTHFDMLFDKFSIICPNGTKNTFLTDDEPLTQKNLGSKKTGYNQFRLNWIILLAFHTLYIGNTTSETVGELIKVLYDAFLGWMAMSTHKDTFERMFRNTLVRQTPAQAYSEQVVKRINDINGNDPTLQPLVKAIKDKLCELQKNPVNPVNHDDEYDEIENDLDYVPPEGGDSDDDSVRSSELAEAAAELRGLSRPEQGLGRTRSQRPPVQTTSFRRGPMRPDELLSAPSDERDPDLDFMNDSDLSDVEEPPERPKVSPLTLPLQRGESLGAPQSERTGYPRSRKSLAELKDMGVRVGRLPPARPSSSPSSSLSSSISDRPRQTLRPGAVSQFHKDANKKAAKTGMLLPQTTEEELRYQQQRSQPNVLTMPRKPLSVGLSYRPPQAAPASTPAAPASTPAPPSEQPREGTIVRRQQQSFKRRELKPFNQGGNNKKRTRKHKKHTSISASRRPTRRRRNPPTEGHKYTRKRPRT